jgi:sulfatase maturation enzyme AslB (radical SAM superfamily)
MCYEWGVNGSYKNNEPAFLPVELIEKILFEIHPNCKHIDLFGGEPTLHPHFQEILRLIHKYGITVHIPTNGILLDELVPLFLKEKPECIWVSVDGPPDINDQQRGKGTFDAAWRGLKALTEAKAVLRSKSPQIGVTTVVTPFNCQHIKDLYLNYLNRIQLDYVSIEFQSWLSEEHIKKYRDIASDLFGVKQFRYVQGFACKQGDMANLNIKQIVEDVSIINDIYTKAGIKVFSRPQDISFEILDAYKNGNFSLMPEYKKRCAFPWLYAEISAHGDVCCCHCFYDIVFGNVFKSSILDIWNGESFSKFRSLLKKDLLPICPACCNFYLSHSLFSKHR